ncbi:MAG: hypothetical protein E7G49_07445 [Cutibacterium granulosum]|nr:hypothetical protein [Cutibacterium granulosum]MDU3768592.1 hypothetical protein [Cutibacterium granulosum]
MSRIVVFLVLAVVAALFVVKSVNSWNSNETSGIRRIYLVAFSGVPISIALSFLFSSFPRSKFARWLTIVLSVLFLVFVFFAWISNLVSQSMRGYDATFNEWIRDRLRWISKRIKKFWRIVSPPGVKELGRFDRALDEMLSMRGSCIFFGVVLLLCLVLMFSIGVWNIEDAPVQVGPTIRSVLGYNGLAVATCVTVSFLITVTLLTVVCRLGVLRVTPDVRKSFEVVVAWIGYFSMAGLLIAAVVPLVATPDNASSQDQARVSPTILIDLPAVFAVIGAIIGMVIGATMILSCAKNLLLRRFFPAIVYVVVVVASVKYFDVTPREVFNRATSDTKSMVTSCDESLLEQHLDDGAFFIHFTRHCDGRDLILDNDLYLWTIVVIACIASTGLFIRDVRDAVAESRRRDLVKGA